MNERLLLRLPHRQMVFTFPKVLRGFFRHHRTLYGEIARQVYAMILRFYNAAAGCSALKPPSPPKSPAQHGPG